MTDADDDVGTPETRRLRAIVVDDDPLARRIVIESLREGDVDVVAEAGDGEEAVTLAVEHRPDVVLMDVAMPGRDGIWATQQLTAQAPEVHVLLLSIAGDTELAVLGLRSGASGYLTKDLNVDELPDVLREIVEGRPALAPDVANALITHLRTHRVRGIGVRPVSSPLTTREWEVLDRLAAGRTQDEIATEFVLSVETVRSHVKNAMRKLGVKSRAEAIEAAEQLRRG
jgi:DNA-binding NarL/FixJ family response regulator